jgi:hypothetical protein
MAAKRKDDGGGVGPWRRWTAASLGLAWLLLAFSAPAAASDPAGTAVPGVTVIAPKPPASVRVVPTPAIRGFVKSHAAPSRTGQLTRWRRSVCPETVGLTAQMNDFVSQRVKNVAAAVGAPGGRCKTDVEIIFTSEPQRLLDSIRKKAPVLLGFHYRAQLLNLARFSHPPIQAWYVTATQGSLGGHGGLGTGQLSGALGTDDGADLSGAAVDDDCCPTPGGAAGSRFTEGLSNQIAAVMVIADSRAVEGRTIGSIADYVAMLVLSKVDPAGGCGELASIVNLMADQCGQDVKADALTDSDIAYLKALYSIDMTRFRWVQQDSIADLMATGGAK